MLTWLVLFLATLSAVQEPSITPRPARAEAAQVVDRLHLRTYEVSDIVAELGLDFAPPELGVPQPSLKSVAATEKTEPSPLPTEAQIAQRKEAATNLLAELARTHIEPKLADPDASLRCSLNGTVVAMLTLEQHVWLKQFLTGLREFNGLVEVNARILTAPAGVLESWKLTPSATLGSEKDLEVLLGQIKADGRFEELNVPTLSMQPAQRAYVATVNQVSYVKSYSVQIVEPGPIEIADPEVATILEGTTLDVRAVPLPGGVFALALEIQHASVVRPIRTQKIRVSAGPTPEVEVGVPEVISKNFSAKVLLASGASVVLVTADTKPERDLAVIVTLKRVERGATDRR